MIFKPFLSLTVFKKSQLEKEINQSHGIQTQRQTAELTRTHTHIYLMSVNAFSDF